MSKMSQLQMELTEQANELGFATVEEALAKGYEVDYEDYKLVNPYVLDREQKKAHEAWLEERDTLLKNLEEQEEFARESYEVDHTVIRHAIEFIRKGEM